MKANELIQFVTVFLLPIGIVIGIYFWLKNLLEDLATRITGIWVNSDQSFRVLIYDIGSTLQGDVSY